jgi:hypothetical protein
MTVTVKEHGQTLPTGMVVDQAVLHGLLDKVRDPGLQLISVNGSLPDNQTGETE